MANGILAVVTGLVVWVVITIVAGLIMRGAWSEYAAVADAMTFTLAMMLARLSIGGVATLAAGYITALVARRATPAILTTGLILLGLFIPQHVMLWDKFPVWYHFTFLLSLVPLTYAGGKIASRWQTARVPRGQQAMPSMGHKPRSCRRGPVEKTCCRRFHRDFHRDGRAGRRTGLHDRVAGEHRRPGIPSVLPGQQHAVHDERRTWRALGLLELERAPRR